MKLTPLEEVGLKACKKFERTGCYDRPDTMHSLELKGLVYGISGRGGRTAYFLTEDGRKALRGL